MDANLSSKEFLQEDGHGWSDDAIRERHIEDVESEFSVKALLADLKANLPPSQYDRAEMLITYHVDALAYDRSIEKGDML